MMLQRNTEPQLDYANELVERFGAQDGGSRILGKGWGIPEADFVWSEGKFAELRIPVSWRRAQISLSVWGFVPQNEPAQDVLLFVNGRLQDLQVISERAVLSTEVYLEGVAALMIISFYLPNARRPCDFGPTPDSRVLALALASLTLKHD